MSAVSLTSNTRAALNLAETGAQQGLAVAALKSATVADRAIVQVIEDSAAALKATPPAGQGRLVDRIA
jgi:hypothetical protein